MQLKFIQLTSVNSFKKTINCLRVFGLFVFICNLFAQSNIDMKINLAMQNYKLPGLSAAIIKNGNIVWKMSYGYADIEKKIPVTDSTLFMLASISKTFVGVALLQQWEKYKFSLDEDINNYLDFPVRNPNFPEVPITFRMLLTHTSSICGDGKFQNLKLPDFTWGYDHPTTIGEFLKDFFILGRKYYNSNNFNNLKPGTVFDYSSIAPTLIAYLVERLSSLTFEQYCQQNIFAPLKMNQSSWFLNNINQTRLAIPYQFQNNKYVKYLHRGTPLYPCGWLKTDINQLSNYLIALMQKGVYKENHILNSASIDSMTTSQLSFVDGMGLMIYQQEEANNLLWGHEGVSTGVRTFMFYNKEDETGVIVISNGLTETLKDITTELLLYSKSFTSISEVKTPYSYKLSQNYPNPFNPTTTIEFDIGENGNVRLDIFNLLGEKVITLLDGYKSSGKHKTIFNGTNLSSGIYYYKITTKRFTETKKLILLK